MQKIVQTIYNAWVKIPAGLRAGFVAFVAVLVTAALAFTWRFPNNWAEAKDEVNLFLLFIVPIAYAAFQKTIWPPLFAWLLTLLQLQYTASAAMQPPQLVKAA